MAEFDYLFDVKKNNNYQADNYSINSGSSKQERAAINFSERNGSANLTTKETLFADNTQIPFKPKKPNLKVDWNKLNYFQSRNLMNYHPIDYLTKTPVNIPKLNNINNPFASHTKKLMYKVNHRTKLLNIAQNYLGIQEVSPTEYKHLPENQKKHTQMALIGSKGHPNESWCAYAISALCDKTKINIGGDKKQVQEFINWGESKGYYKPIKINHMTTNNYMSERKTRTKEIEQQFKNMKEGDLIIWKSDTMTRTPFGLIHTHASHIGIIEDVDKNGDVIVIEGNGNEYKKSPRFDRYINTTPTEAKKGNQKIGTFEKLNNRDGLIRTEYTPNDLASHGYSGYIDMQKIIK